jgi:hypothetical protein
MSKIHKDDTYYCRTLENLRLDAQQGCTVEQLALTRQSRCQRWRWRPRSHGAMGLTWNNAPAISYNLSAACTVP